MNDIDVIAHVLERAREVGIVKVSHVNGCTEDEIARLEEKFQLTLPGEFRRFLIAMGKGAGPFPPVYRYNDDGKVVRAYDTFTDWLLDQLRYAESMHGIDGGPTRPSRTSFPRP